MAAYGTMEKIFAKIQDHDTPDLFTQEFLRYKLGFSREADRAFLAVAKRLGIVALDNKPTALYLRIRDPKKAPAAFVEAIQIGYPTLYAKNPDVHTLDRASLAALIQEVTGLPSGAVTLRTIVGTFVTLRHLAFPAMEVERVFTQRKTPEEKVETRRKIAEKTAVNRRKAAEERRMK
jgi:hypothetical protein